MRATTAEVSRAGRRCAPRLTRWFLGLLLIGSLSDCSCGEDTRRCFDVEVGGLGCPCETFADCNNLVCGATGTCESVDPRCFPLGADDCPCESEDQCLPGMRCGGGLCARIECANDDDCDPTFVCVSGACYPQSCSEDADCPPGQECDGDSCRPADCIEGTGTSGCYTGEAGTAKFGVCDYGIWQCTSDGRVVCAGERTPMPEICNGEDDDCDGETDETDPGQEPVCPDGDCEPTFELCNDEDDDCDGLTDEDQGTTTCGMGVCQRTVPRCMDGEAQDCTPGQPEAVACDGRDNDCDGEVDEADEGCSCTEGDTQTCYSGNPPETEGIGECRSGLQRCVNELWGRCEGDRTPVDGEVCDGRDEDCNGVADDGLGQEECGDGICRRVVGACSGGSQTACVPGDPGTEVCNGLDDDCDTLTDEDPPPECRVCTGGMLENAPDGTPCGTERVCISGECRDTPDVEPSVGCADGEREGFVDQNAYPGIAACAGAWDVPGVTRPNLVPTCARQGGDDGALSEGTGCSAADLCAAGWHVCDGRSEVALYAPAGCDDAVPPGAPGNSLFYAVSQASENNIVCNDEGSGNNDVFGCGNLGVGLNADSSCAPLNRALASTQEDSCGFNEAMPNLGPWECVGGAGSDLHEGENVTKKGCPGGSCSFDGQPVGNSDKGGVLCCQDAN